MLIRPPESVIGGFLCFLILLCAFGHDLPAQGIPLEEDAPRVSRINIEFLTLETVSREAVLAHVQIREGMRYSQTLIDRSIRSLYQTRRFDFIEARTADLPDGSVELTFVVQPKYRIHEMHFEGNDRYSDRRLRRQTEVRSGQVLDERRLQADRNELLTYYREKGFSRATVQYDIDRNPDTGLAVVTYRIEEGPRLRIRRVNFVGNEAFSERKLRSTIETRRRWMFSWLTGTGRFDEDTLQDDIQTLREFYQENGYLDVNISEANVTLDYIDDRRIEITIRVDEGRQYRVGEITFEVNELYHTLLLFRVPRLRQGDVFSPSKLDEDLDRLRDFYGAGGYLDTRIRAERFPNIETGDIDLNYVINESERFHVESIRVEGNTKTKSTVIIRELALAPGDVFNKVWMKNSEARLQGTRFFEEVNLHDEPTDIPNRRNLKVSVKEGRTGQFQFGAGFSSLERAVFFFELSQGNFDLFNYRTFFQGAGQKFRLRLSIGSRSNEVVLAFEEPWFLEKQLALGVELFRRETDFASVIYNELRMGFEVYLRKRLFELVTGQFSYRLEDVEIFDVAPGAPDSIRELEGNWLISKLGMTLVRDTRDHLIFTTRGSRFTFSTEFAGLGGDIEYMKLESRNAWFIPTFDAGNQVLSVLARVGSFWEYSDERVPFFERFFLGGPNSLRGFEYRDVGPRQQSSNPEFRGLTEAVGGNSYGFGSFEYSVQVAEPLRLAVFYDWGFVNQGDFNFNPSGFNDNWGFGVRLLVLGNPLRLDLGIPITSTDFFDDRGNLLYSNRRGNQFNFSFGTRF